MEHLPELPIVGDTDPNDEFKGARQMRSDETNLRRALCAYFAQYGDGECDLRTFHRRIMPIIKSIHPRKVEAIYNLIFGGED